jgi:putative glutamine amidotransferase
MSKKLKIGISFSTTNFANYWNWFSHEDLGDEFELVELSFLKNNKADFDACEGFVLTGGTDIEPSTYNGSSSYELMPEEFQVERDQFEEKIYRHAQQFAKPVLGICRGMQLVNILEGGRLIQDLAIGNDVHRKTSEDKEHIVHVEDGSLLGEVVGRRTGKINSAHHQAVDPETLGKNIMVSAFAAGEEGIVEGIEFRNKTNHPFMLCVQWHPERMKEKETSPFSKNIKERFLAEIKKSGLTKNANH